MNEIISSPSNKFVKEIKSLHKKKERWNSKKFFVEGIKSVYESIVSDGKIDYILYSESLFKINGGMNLYEFITKKNLKLIEITDKLLNSICDTENPQGIIAVINIDSYKLEDVLKENNFILILDRLQDPGNMGTIIRTADALGVDFIIISEGCVDVFNPKTIRSTMGSIFHIPLVFCEDIFKTISLLKSKNISIMSTALDNSKDCYKVDLKKNLGIIIGNEANGVSEELIHLSDELLKIPMEGKAESLNAAIASAIIIYEVIRQRQKI